MIKETNINDPFLLSSQSPLDAKSFVKEGHIIPNIETLLTNSPVGLYDGMLVQDGNFSVTWQIYDTGTTWAAKLYDGKFSVRVVSTESIASLSGTKTIDGVSCIADDIVLLVAQQTPHMNGSWIVKSGAWERHPLFASSTNGINFPGVTFVVKDGTLSNSQWKFTTTGTITMSDNIADFATATWLDFEATDPSKNGITKELSSNGTISRFDKLTTVDASSSDIEVLVAANVFLNEVYTVQKIDQSSNIVTIKNSSDIKHVLLEQNDWAKITSKEPGDFVVQSNRINKLIVQSAVTANGKLGIEVPSGYTLYSLTGLSNTDVVIDVGKTSEATDIGTFYLTGGVKETVIVNSSSVTGIWVSSSDWNSASVVFEMLLVNTVSDIAFVDEYTAGEWLFPTGGEPPDIQNVTLGGITTRMYGFDGVSTTEWMANSFEINHNVAIDVINDSDVINENKIEWHVHFMPSTTDSGTVVWQLEYAYCPLNASPIAQTTVLASKVIESNSQYKHLVVGATLPKPSSGWNIGDVIVFNLKRNPTYASDVSDTYGADALLVKTALHIPVDSNGSRSRYTK